MIPSDVPYLDWDEIQEPGAYEEHGAVTISLHQLMLDDIVNEEWWQGWSAVSEEMRARLWKKFVGRFEFREIGILPPGRWLRRVLAKLDEIMPKYAPMYAAADNGNTVMTGYDEWHKGRDVHSSFPQTAIAGNQDYASSGTDSEHETVRDYGMLDVAERIAEYNDIDVMMLDDLDTLFCPLVSTTIPYL